MAFCDDWCTEHHRTLHDEVVAARYLRAEEVARAADAAFALRQQKLRCPSTLPGTCPATGVHDCDYCHDLYVDSSRQRCPSTPRGTCPAMSASDYWDYDYPYCDYCHDQHVDRRAPETPADVCARCDNSEATWRCECTCACGSPHGHPGLCATALDATPAAAATPAADAGLATWRVVPLLEAWWSRRDA